MVNDSLKASPPVTKEDKSLNASLLTFDLPNLIEKMKHSHSYVKGELNTMILLKSPEKQIVLTALHEATEINSFQADESITFQIIEGKLMFRTQKESVILDKGQFLTLHEKIKYSLTTEEETVLLLTMSKGTLQPAENHHRVI